MRNLFTMLLCFVSVVLYGQSALPSITLQYDNQMLLDENGDKLLFNPEMLNILFAGKVGTAFNGTNDLSLQKFFATLDADDNSLSLGVNIDTRGGDELKKLGCIVSAGAKLKLENKFATLSKGDDFQEDNVGVFLKFSYIGDGIINYQDKEHYGLAVIEREKTILKHREFLYRKYDDKVAAFNSNELDNFRTQHFEEKIYDYERPTLSEQLMKKSNEIYKELANEEIEYIEKHQLYRYLFDWWLSTDVYVPLGEKTYMVTPNKITNALEPKTLYPLEFSLTGNIMLLFSHGESVFLKGKIGFKNNNNILVDNKTAMPFQKTSTANNGTIVVYESEDGYELDYDHFITTSFVVEPAFFMFKNTIGFSPSIEFNSGEYNKTNWKLGIPVSLKDKEGKPKVNFEIQWKEINTFNSSNHYVGISTSFLFGDLIN